MTVQVSSSRVADVVSRLGELAVPLLDDDPMVGMALGVVHEGRLVGTWLHGFADTAAGRRVDTRTLFRIGSISKTFTGIATLQLVEQGRLDLDDPVTKHLRTFAWHQPPGTRPATIRDVMTHTSGVGEVRTGWDLLDLKTLRLGVKQGRPVPALADYYKAGLHARIAPGERWAYANHAITALGQIVEDVSGQPFAEYAREHVFTPLGMTNTHFLQQPGHRDHLAQGYALDGATVKPEPWRDVIVAAAGSVFSDLEDMTRYCTALLGGGANEHGRVLAPETLDSMGRAHWRQDPRLPGMGLTFLLDEFDGHRVVWHDGGWPAFVSSMLTAPDDGVAVLAFTNSGAGGVHALADRVLRELLGVPPLTTGAARRRAPASPELWHELVGIYAPPRGGSTNSRPLSAFGLELEVLVRDGHLVVRSLIGPLRKGVRLYAADPLDPLLFEAVVGEDEGSDRTLLQIAFQRDVQGRVTSLAGVALLPFQFDKRHRLRGARNAGALAGGAVAAAGALTAARAVLRRR